MATFIPPASPDPGVAAGDVCIDTIAILRRPSVMYATVLCKQRQDGMGMAKQKTIVLTGASSGLGAIAARELATQGWDVAVVGRNPERTSAVASAIGGTPFLADYDRLDDVRALAAALLEKYPSIDVLANNAGGLVGRRGTTADGHERTFQHNHLAPFLLTGLLTERLVSSAGRVVNTASVANLSGRIRLKNLDSTHRPYLNGWPAYGTSKLETILFTRELARRTAIVAYSFHPGFVATSFAKDTALGRAMMRVSARSQISPEAGAAPLIQLASNPDIQAPSGTYFDGLKPDGKTTRQGNDLGLAAALWDASATLVGLP
jgi:NAD(P)-dependent dehydrogenase (short-subunit alcohol dehydrogenase family)